MGKSPAFQFYPSDWQRDLDDHPIEIEGAWIRICGRLFWSDGIATKTIQEWSNILRKNRKKTLEILLYLERKKIGDLVIQKNEITITCRRMVKDARLREIRKSAGLLGGNPNLLSSKKEHFCLTKPQPNQNPIDNQKPTPSSSSSSSSSSSIQIPPIPPKKPSAKINHNAHPLFQKFWESYPRKIAKPKAEIAFKKINPDEILLEKILSGLEDAKQSPQWTKDNGEFIPHPTTWLNQRRWEDQINCDHSQKIDIELSKRAKLILEYDGIENCKGMLIEKGINELEADKWINDHSRN